ncbi:MAG TPA: 4-alpha-glucanotransferase [Steroidobacteraceae bacterium]|nr:4-alpha-glucanotransferase [Steroidobacteraceae bacterium]
MHTALLKRRRAGVLLHLTCLPDALGRGGRGFIDWLAQAGFGLWQVLPVGPTGVEGSPYWVRSDAAGNTLLLDAHELPPLGGPEQRGFVEAASWLEDYARFETLAGRYPGVPWWSWPQEYRDRDPRALAQLEREHAEELRRVRDAQFAFAWQWARLRAYAHERGIELLGDLPFYVAPDSAETWAQREQFQLDATGRPRAVAGVPPDYFSQMGQLWGNPLYDWDHMRRDGFHYWVQRLRLQLARVDVLRLDHFRALAAHWAVPAAAPDARHGSWQHTPGRALLSTARLRLGPLPLVAEDLGVITPDVEDLRRDFGLPGMRVLQFAFDGKSDNPHLPHMHSRDTVVYTGTHDNDTTRGWYDSLDAAARSHVDDFLGTSGAAIPEALVRAALGSVAGLAVLPLQDLLGLGSEARFNTPATAVGNWRWRVPQGALTPALAAHSRHLNELHGRA